MPRAKIVVVEDEPAIRRGVVDALRIGGYEVAEAADGAIGLTAATQPNVDLVLLDLLLPRRDGLDVLCEMRKICPTRPVIILTARGTEEDRVRGLKMGADDYVVKPFSARELLARVEAVLRRSAPKTPEVRTVSLGNAIIDLARREIRWSPADRHELSETESLLLQYLVNNRTRAVSREELLTRVWGIEARTVDMHIARLRAKLRNPDGKDTAEAIITVRSHGYMAGPGLSVPAQG
jgi:two-component system, OmpR family, response regulator RpaB